MLDSFASFQTNPQTDWRSIFDLRLMRSPEEVVKTLCACRASPHSISRQTTPLLDRAFVSRSESANPRENRTGGCGATVLARCIDATAGNARNKDLLPPFRSQMRSTGRETVDHPGVNFYGPFGIVGGLGSAARGYLAASTAAGISVSVIPVNEMFVHHASVGKAGRAGQPPRHPISLVQANANSVRRFLHFRSRSFARARYKIGLWVWESPALRDEWWSEIDHFDEIWAPSTFCQRAVQAVTKKPVKVVPYVVSAVEPQGSGWREKLQIGKTAFVFLYMFDAASFVTRKNPQCLIDAFDSAFADDPDVRLVLKVSNADLNPGFSEYLDALVRRDARCVVLRQMMQEHELAALVRACNCYVSPHRSEGFGLTVAEAMAKGFPRSQQITVAPLTS